MAVVPAELITRPVYSYIVTTINTAADYRLVQTGCAPNFDGGRITLCTCKHKDRATFKLSGNPLDPWKLVWVAGFTSKSADPSRSLAYLMCVERSFLNQSELWDSLPTGCRRAKCATKTVLGDLFEPKVAARVAPYNPLNYKIPIAGHVHSPPGRPNRWHNDIVPWQGAKPHRLLLGMAGQSYRWSHTKMILKLGAIGDSAHHKIFTAFREFLANLQEFEP
jgi:hypothetical protein